MSANTAPSFTFDSDGIVTTNLSLTDTARALILQTDGKILLGGYSGNYLNYDFSLARYNADGSLDASFDGDGKFLTAIGPSGDLGYSLALQADNKILLAGYS
jgi:uncharacterized delta-60 repeat protein